jgi:hypothetical protein
MNLPEMPAAVAAVAKNLLRAAQSRHSAHADDTEKP